jgi:ABC-type nitrate/sulfonate/bicarbonate transport system ATPase subunit
MVQEIIKIESLSKNHTDFSGYTIQLFDNITFDIEKDKVVTLLAPLRSGKSDILKLIAGIDEQVIISNRKRIFIPAKPSSFPWLNVKENIIFNIKQVDDSELKNAIKLVGLNGYEDHFPNDNSIGFRLRITLARAILNKPELIIIDESISVLPFKRKLEFYSLVRKIASQREITILYSTSSASEAIRISDKIILMSELPSKIISDKLIIIDETTRIDEKANFKLPDYFSEHEINIFSD